MKAKWVSLVVAMVAVAVVPVAAVDIETVPVGNVGNAADTEIMTGDGTTGYGSVGYAYNVGKYEVTAGQYAEFLNAVAATDSYGLYNASMDSDIENRGCQITRNGVSGSYTYDFSGGTVEAPGSTAADWSDRPVNYVSWGDAARFANWLHNGQPGLDSPVPQDENSTEDGAYLLDGATTDAELLAVSRKEAEWTWAITSADEWYKAAYYNPATSSYYDYPTGSDSVPSNDLVEPTDPGNNANFYQSGYTIGSPYWRTEVGEFENSDSPYGTFDQGANIWEWNEAILSGSYRGLRGGSCYNGDYYLHASYHVNSNPTDEYDSIGFRVVEVPEPTTMSLLSLGGLALLRRRRAGWRRVIGDATLFMA